MAVSGVSQHILQYANQQLRDHEYATFKLPSDQRVQQAAYVVLAKSSGALQSRTFQSENERNQYIQDNLSDYRRVNETQVLPPAPPNR